MKNTQVARLLAYVTGLVNQQLLLQNEYLIAENRILRSHLPVRVPLTKAQRATLAEIAKRMGRRALEQVASVAKPETILAWYRKLIAGKFDGSKHRAYPGRPAVSQEITDLVVRMAREYQLGIRSHCRRTKESRPQHFRSNRGKHSTSVRDCSGSEARPTKTWAEFIRSHLAVLAGVDFFTVEVLTWRGLATYYVLFFCI
jgi:putative transposase